MRVRFWLAGDGNRHGSAGGRRKREAPLFGRLDDLDNCETLGSKYGSGLEEGCDGRDVIGLWIGLEGGRCRADIVRSGQELNSDLLSVWHRGFHLRDEARGSDIEDAQHKLLAPAPSSGGKTVQQTDLPVGAEAGAGGLVQWQEFRCRYRAGGKRIGPRRTGRRGGLCGGLAGEREGEEDGEERERSHGRISSCTIYCSAPLRRGRSRGCRPGDCAIGRRWRRGCRRLRTGC